MTELTWKETVLGWIGSLAWTVFCWATGYDGFVCEWAKSQDYPQLPCDCWFQEQDSKKDAL